MQNGIVIALLLLAVAAWVGGFVSVVVGNRRFYPWHRASSRLTAAGQRSQPGGDSWAAFRSRIRQLRPTAALRGDGSCDRSGSRRPSVAVLA
jgi:hypothetical protein